MLWQLVKEAHPTDVEAAHKAKDLAASETIARGQYEEAAGGNAGAVRRCSGGSRPRGDPRRQDRLGRDEADTAPRSRHRGRPDRAARCTCNSPPCTAGTTSRTGPGPCSQQGLGPDRQRLPAATRTDGAGPRRRSARTSSHRPTSELAAAEAGEDDPGHDEPEDLLRIRAKLLKEINTREIDMFRREGRPLPERPAATGWNWASAC